MQLWPENHDVWEAYQHVGDVLLPGLGGAPRLDMAGVIAILNWLGLSPTEPEERQDLLHKIKLLHQVRVERTQEPGKTESLEDDDGQ